jgi:hypothetical protein
VQNGWLRASHRALDPSSTVLQPVHPDTSASSEVLPPGQFVSARVALFPFAHIFRAGSRIRITVEAPGGNRPFWAFGDLAASGTVVNDIAHSIGRPSQVVLPVITDPAPGIPAAYPPCGSLRGEPCRAIASDGAPTDVQAVGSEADATVTWTAAVPRAGDTIAAYHVTEQPDGATVDVAGTATSAAFTHLAAGAHTFGVTVEYATSHATVAATASNTVTIVETPPTTTTTTPTSTSTTTPQSTTTTVAGGTQSEASTSTTVTVVDFGTLPPSAPESNTGGGLPFTGSRTSTLAAVGFFATIFGAFLAARKRRRTLP